MKIALTFVASLALAACSAGTPDLGTTTGGASTTGAASTTTGGSSTTATTSSSTGAGTGSGTTTGSSTTGGTTGTVYTGPCASNLYTCPAGTAMAGAVYPGAAPADCGASPGQTFPDVELAGGGILNFSTTETKDDVGAFSTNSVHMHDLFCSGFKYVFIDVSARWCIHCKVEASEIPGWTGSAYKANSLYQAWLGAGGTVFSVLVQSNDSTSATQSDLTYWVDYYNTPYPMSLDTYQTMAAFIGLAGWPENMIVDLSNMQVKVTVGGDDPTFYQTYCTILGIASCPSP